MSELPPSPSPAFNLAAHVLSRGAQQPDAPALELLGPQGQTAQLWTYGDLIAAVRGTARGLQQMGLPDGARVLLRLGNTPDFPIAYLGVIAAGLVAVPTSAQLTEPEITALARDLDPALILQDPTISAPQSAAPRCLLPELQSWYTLPPAPFALGDPERPAYIIFTSGTSGRARGVIHAHRAICARQMMHQGWYGLTGQDRLLHAGAFNWTFTLGTGLMDPWTLGATALIPAPGTPPEALPEVLAAQGATLFAGAPGIYRKALRRPQSQMPALPDLRHGLSAGEKLPEALRRAWKEATGCEIYEAFGMSECSTFISASPAAQAAPGTLGRPQPGRRVALLDAQGVPVPTGTAGVIAVHRSDPGLMLGYLNAPEETRAVFQGDWFLTGDMALAQPNGDIAYQGRADDMMNAGGFRVSPLEVEAVFTGQFGITQCAAVDLPVKEGVSIIALYYCAEHPVQQSRLERLAAQHLARYKQPRLFQHRASLPVNANGKLARSALRRDSEFSDGQT